MKAVIFTTIDLALAILVSLGLQWVMPELRGQGPAMAATYLGLLAALRHHERG